MALLAPAKHALVTDAIRRSGWSALYVSGATRMPFRIAAVRGTESVALWIYMWGLTPGGRKALRDEYRIQVQTSRFSDSPGARTLVLGWWKDGGVFAGFDVEKHRGPLGDNVSIQVSLTTLRNAVERGFDVSSGKGNGEVVAAFKPEYFMAYVESAQAIHGGREDLGLLKAAANPDVAAPKPPDAVPSPRKEVIRLVSTKVRASGFRDKVLRVYDHRCAFCDIQLDLVDAAHILPVASTGSTDDTPNGVALCALHHRAYDAGLVTMLPDYAIRVNEEKAAQLELANRAGRIEDFRADLKTIMSVPPNVADRPAKANVIRGNNLRGWPVAS